MMPSYAGYNGYQGFGAVSIGTPEFAACMKKQIASKKAGGPYDPKSCVQAGLTPAGGGGIPTIAWVGLGIVAVGGAAALYWYKFRK